MTRKYWVEMLTKLANPVLSAAKEGKLGKTLPQLPSQENRERITNVESVARLLSGMAPWLELGEDETEEGKLRGKFASMARAAIADITNPASLDYGLFDSEHNKPNQPLVDTAYLGLAITRAPKELYFKLTEIEKNNLIKALQDTRKTRPICANWLMFSALVEVGLKVMGQEYDPVRIDYALRMHKEWLLGNGAYGDGPHFTYDYYNSYVIQPMLVECAKHMEDIYEGAKEPYGLMPFKEEILTNAKFYAGVQEKIIAEDGSYPPLGRSIVYRGGAFHSLAQSALMESLPESATPAAVRCALTAMLKKTLEAPNTFDENGFLKLGLCGTQPGLAEGYIAVSSLYICANAFLPLGLPETNEFWSAPDEKWTQAKLWNGEDIDVYKGYYKKNKTT